MIDQVAIWTGYVVLYILTFLTVFFGTIALLDLLRKVVPVAVECLAVIGVFVLGILAMILVAVLILIAYQLSRIEDWCHLQLYRFAAKRKKR